MAVPLMVWRARILIVLIFVSFGMLLNTAIMSRLAPFTSVIFSGVYCFPELSINITFIKSEKSISFFDSGTSIKTKINSLSGCEVFNARCISISEPFIKVNDLAIGVSLEHPHTTSIAIKNNVFMYFIFVCLTAADELQAPQGLGGALAFTHPEERTALLP